LTGLLHRAVLRTRGVPGLGALYRGIYAGALGLSARALHALPGLASVYLHRGLSRCDWEPGVSDIDLILVLGDEEPDEGLSLPRLQARLAALRRIFPMLGDIWLGSAEELRHYLRWGGLRAWEDAPDWKRLRGPGLEFPPLAESGPKRRWLDPWTWLFLSHMEIGRRYFDAAAGPPEKRDADMRKLYLDARRYGDYILADAEAGPAPLTRAEAQARAPEAGRLSPRELWLDSSLRLARASRLVLARLGSSGECPAVLPAATPKEREVLSRLLSCLGCARAVVRDQPYHTYLLLGENAAAMDYARAAEALLAAPVPGVPLVLEPAAWALALQSSYLGAPLGWLGAGAGRGSAAGGKLFPGWGACAVGEPPATLPLLTRRLRWETAAEAASWMALWWRPLWIGSGSGNRFVLHHLYTRALGLRLALAGEPGGPFCDWELTLPRAAALMGEDGRFAARLRRLLLDEPGGRLDSVSRGQLAPGHLGALTRLMAGLRRALAKGPPA